MFSGGGVRNSLSSILSSERVKQDRAVEPGDRGSKRDGDSAQYQFLDA